MLRPSCGTAADCWRTLRWRCVLTVASSDVSLDDVQCFRFKLLKLPARQSMWQCWAHTDLCQAGGVQWLGAAWRCSVYTSHIRAVHACCAGCGWFCGLLQEDVAAALSTVKEACDLQDLPYRCVYCNHPTAISRAILPRELLALLFSGRSCGQLAASQRRSQSWRVHVL